MREFRQMNIDNNIKSKYRTKTKRRKHISNTFNQTVDKS